MAYTVIVPVTGGKTLADTSQVQANTSYQWIFTPTANKTQVLENTDGSSQTTVEHVASGTVAVLVKADGSEKVVKTCLTTETGVAVTLSDGLNMNQSLTWEHLAVIMWSCAGKPAADGLSGYPDRGSVSSWAQAATILMRFCELDK